MKNTRLFLLAGVLFGSLSLNALDGLAMSSEGGGTSIVISSQPRFINIPDQGFSVSIGSPYDIVSYDNRYYLYQNGSWYNSRDYRGPWQVTRESNLPDKIRRHRIGDIRRYRDTEYSKRGNNGQNQRNNNNNNRRER
ncbi:MAG: BcpO-related WXXGXW repeat protein [Chlorobiaceae bacterium]|nr:BcpO-related WXXGXW repeat protein [Chlorobiaceae bacterium]